MSKRIVLTGGGTAGHVTPNLALIPHLREAGYEIYYVGSINGMEKKLVEDYDIPYLGVETGKFRRYWDPKNFTDPFRVIKGFNEAHRFLREYRPNVIFSKGGYVSVPVVQAGASLRIPCICHESDLTPGLANKLCTPFAHKICCNFPETLKDLPSEKAILTGTPIREELFHGDRSKGLELCGFDESKPVLMVIGGSLGALSVNQSIRENLRALLEDFQVVHICGREKMDNLMLTIPGYKQFEYVKEDLCHLYAMSDIVISRAGANAICELLALNKPNILVPLPTGRGDQKLNAASFEAQGYSIRVEDDMLAEQVVEKVHELYENRQAYIDRMSTSNQVASTSIIMQLLEQERLP